MQRLIFATNNQHKVDEIKSVVGNSFQILTLKEAGINIDIEEPFDTLKENASIKSSTIFNLTKTNCFSEDTGLEIDALNGEPGVKSARYAGVDRDFEANIDKVLEKLGATENRTARFRTVISLILNEKEFFFEGICEGEIIHNQTGIGGFGYDPIFVPKGSQKSFAEMTTAEKNEFSHRRKATDLLLNFLSQTGKTNF